MTMAPPFSCTRIWISFFPRAILGVAHEALRDWLWEQPQDAQPLLAQLSPAGRDTMNLFLARQIERLRPRLLDAIQADQSQLAAISPEGKLADLRVPVFILHGATDDIIPSTESLWLEKEIPRKYLRDVLITPAFSHVDPEKGASWRDELRLVQFSCGVFCARRDDGNWFWWRRLQTCGGMVGATPIPLAPTPTG